MTVITNELSAELFLQLYTSVGWEPPGRHMLILPDSG